MSKLTVSVKEAKEEICEIGRRLYALGFANSNDGNISVRFSDDEIWVTPTAVSKGYMTPDMLVRVNIDGEVLEGDRNPSSEVKMHLRVYQKSPDTNAVVHAHPPMSTAFAVCHKPLDKYYLTEAVAALGIVPVTEYATPSTEEVPDSVEPFVEEYTALLIANHGALAWDETLLGAFYKMQQIEYLAQIHWMVPQIGTPHEIPEKEVERLMGLRSFFKNYSKPRQ